MLQPRPALGYAMVAVAATLFAVNGTVSKVVLAATLYLVFTPVALAFRLMGRDALKLKPNPSTSYWQRKSGAKSGEEYLRQF